MLLIIVISNLIFPRPCDEIGKHNGLKIRGLHGLAGSSPAKGTIYQLILVIFDNKYKFYYYEF